MATWIISPNWLAWILLIIASFSLGAIAVRMWYTPKNGVKWNVSYNSNKNQLRVGELYKTTILTVWLAISVWMMLRVCDSSMMTNDNEFWSKLIAIIGIIVATLIGWQIYSAMDWNSKAERMTKIEDSFSSLISDVQNNRNFAAASVLYIKARNMLNSAYEDPENSKEDFQDCYLTLLKAISLYTAPSVEEQIEDCISWMNGAIENMRRFDVGKDTRFQDECNNLYKQIIANKQYLTIAQQNKLNSLNKKRTGLLTNEEDE